MRHVHNEKWKKTNNGRNRTAKSRKNQNTWRKGKLQLLGNIGSEHHQTSEDERKNKKRIAQTSEKISRNQTLQQNFHQRDKHLGSPPCKILGTSLLMDKGRTQINELKDKEVDDDAQGFVYVRWHRQNLCKKRKRKHWRKHWWINTRSRRLFSNDEMVICLARGNHFVLGFV